MTPAVRPLQIDDTVRLERMFGRLSPETIYKRFFSPLPRLPAWLLRMLTDVDHDCREVLVAIVDDEVVAEARYARDAADPTTAEVAVMVEDGWQHRGVATALVRALTALARQRGIERFAATVLADNVAVLGLIKKTAPVRTTRFDAGVLAMEFPLQHAAA
jgi:RimJ/RimL family protein N-acetyltransferase